MALIALHSAATGLQALSTKLDVIANNLANAENNGFKASRVNFEDLFYEERQQPGVQNLQGDLRPTGIYVGLGTRVSGTQLNMAQGSAVSTGRNLDVMIQGDGFFQVKVPATQGDGLAYTRAGQFYVNANGNLVLNSSNGYMLDPPISIDPTATGIDITQDGRVFVTTPGSTDSAEAGQIQLARFANPQGLKEIGGDLFQRTDASGTASLVAANSEGTGTLQSGYLEASNVDPVNELVDLIKTQRTFEMNSQSIQAADQMLQTVANLRH
jgi:flagellar basal-body rod protein FlgG